MDWLIDPNLWLSFLTLTLLEIILGIDNLIFIAIVVTRLPPEQRASARRLGLALALLMRLALLASIAWIMRLTTPVFEISGQAISWRDLILIGGGIFLIYKGTAEIHGLIEGEASDQASSGGKASLSRVIATIIMLDIVFSLDSVITAVGMVDNLWVMSSAVIVAVLVMLIASESVANFIHRHPTVKMLALSFLLLIGLVLVADGFGFHVPKGFVYVAIGFSLMVEFLNLLYRRGAGKSQG
jgi:predicted tellurium resistance membrane protein TerC